ncbi:MAG: zinc-ribbon domain-containing protein [Pseudomonadota bacterium]
MIVTCPSCEARYRVDEDALSARGGKVRCSSCGHNWVAENDALPLTEPVDPQPVPEAEPEPEPEPVRRGPHSVIRERAEARRRKARLMTELGAWGGVAAMFAVFVGGAWLFRADIVHAMPGTARAYAAVGAEVNPFGLEIADLSVERAEAGGAPAIVVEGVLRNVAGSDRPAGPLQARVLGEDGAVLAEWVVQLESPSLPAAGEERFRTVLQDPPEGGAEIEVVLGEPV